jgi:hypothetical protein
MKVSAFVAPGLGLVMISAQTNLPDLPDPPACVMDCSLFDELTAGSVDDCAVTSAWADGSCLEDCSTIDMTVYVKIRGILCAVPRLLAYGSYEGSYYGSYEGSYYGSHGPETASPTIVGVSVVEITVSGGSFTFPYYTFRDSGRKTVPSSYSDDLLLLVPGSTYRFINGGVSGSHPFFISDIGRLEASTFDIVSEGSPTSGLPSGGTLEFQLPADFAGSLYYYCVPHIDMTNTFKVSSTKEASPSASPTKTALPTVSPTTVFPTTSPTPCANSPGLVGKDGADCDLAEELMASEGLETCADLATHLTQGEAYSEFVTVLNSHYTHCPLTCNSCDGFKIPEETFCEDIIGWKDNYGTNCSAWKGLDCGTTPEAEYAWRDTYDVGELSAIRSSCPHSCGFKPSGMCLSTCDRCDDDGAAQCFADGVYVVQEANDSLCDSLRAPCEICFAPLVSSPLVITISMELTFERELGDDEIEDESIAIETSVADEGGFTMDYVAVTMLLRSDSTTSERRLLSIVYDTSVVISIPAADITGDDEATLSLVASVEKITSDGGLTALTDAIKSKSTVGAEAVVTNVDRAEAIHITEEPTWVPTAAPTNAPTKVPTANPTKMPTTVPTVNPTEYPDSTPGSATKLSSAFGLLISAVCVAYML